MQEELKEKEAEETQVREEDEGKSLSDERSVVESIGVGQSSSGVSEFFLLL